MTQFEQLLHENAETRVEVTYPDNKGNHVTTIRDILDRFLDESQEWKKLWFTNLICYGENHTKMGGFYKIIRL